MRKRWRKENGAEEEEEGRKIMVLGFSSISVYWVARKGMKNYALLTLRIPLVTLGTNNIHKLYVLPTQTVFMCFVWISEQTAIISLYNINWLVFITETECVYCAVRTECWVNVIRANISLQTPDIKELPHHPRLHSRQGVRQKVRPAHKIVAECILKEILFGKPEAIRIYNR